MPWWGWVLIGASAIALGMLLTFVGVAFITTGSKDEKPDWRKLEELPVETVWITVLTELGADWVLATPENSEGKWLATVMSAALFCDAKFTYSNTLYTRLVADQGAWEQVVIPKK